MGKHPLPTQAPAPKAGFVGELSHIIILCSPEMILHTPKPITVATRPQDKKLEIAHGKNFVFSVWNLDTWNYLSLFMAYFLNIIW